MKRKNNGEFYYTESSSGAAPLTSNKLLAVRVWQNLEYCKELFVYYGRYYPFNR